MAARPQRRSRLACFASALLLPSAAALRLTRETEDNATAGVASSRQELSNMGDLQYFGAITVGGQTIAGILDTGSFELVVFSKRCSTCGIAGAYDELNSTGYTKGNLTQLHSYGSGSCQAIDGFDTVSEADGLNATHQAMWLAKQCDMPLLMQASFNAIVGIGPPGQPESTAKSALAELEEAAKNMKAFGNDIPQDLEDSIAQTTIELATARQKPSMLENFGVKVFSECLGKEPGSPGWLIWNDKTREGVPGVQHIPIDGNITWGVSVTGISLGSSTTAMACDQGCGSIIDTGTSLFAVPTSMYDSILSTLNSFMQTQLPPEAAGCQDLSYFPDLVMNVGGQTLSFPPSSYIGRYSGFPSEEVAQFVRTASLEGSQCQLLVMDLGEERLTMLGPMIILGMPFFREYYTTFDLGSGVGNRSLWVSKAGPSCQPLDEGIVSSHADRHHAFTPRTVDASKLRVPRGLDRLRGRL